MLIKSSLFVDLNVVLSFFFSSSILGIMNRK